MPSLWLEYYAENRLFEIQETLDRLLADVPLPKVLDAGCGFASHFRFKPGSKLVGMDTSQEQLDGNEAVDEAILGDIQTYNLSGRNFDAIVCHFVLEHLDAPEGALQNFLRGLSPSGLIVIVAPTVFSLQGLVAKLTPLWFQAFLRRALLGSKLARKRGAGPFRAPYRIAMSPGRVKRFALRHGLAVEYFRLFEGFLTWTVSRRTRIARMLLQTTGVVSRLLTFGKFDASLGAYAIIMKRHGPNAGHATASGAP